jgi:hypothetical protein
LEGDDWANVGAVYLTAGNAGLDQVAPSPDGLAGGGDDPPESVFFSVEAALVEDVDSVAGFSAPLFFSGDPLSDLFLPLSDLSLPLSV